MEEALDQKREADCARRDALEFRTRVRTVRLLAEWIVAHTNGAVSVDPGEAGAEVVTEGELGAIAKLWALLEGRMERRIFDAQVDAARGRARDLVWSEAAAQG